MHNLLWTGEWAPQPPPPLYETPSRGRASHSKDYVDVRHAEAEIGWLFVSAQTVPNYRLGSDLQKWQRLVLFCSLTSLLSLGDLSHHAPI